MTQQVPARYLVTAEPGSQALEFIADYILPAGPRFLGRDVAQAGEEALLALRNGRFRDGPPVDLSTMATNLAALRRQPDLQWLVPTAEQIVHYFGAPADDRAWREDHVWLWSASLTAGGAAVFRNLPLHHFLIAMVEVPGFMAGTRPMPPHPERAPNVRLTHIRHLGLAAMR